MSNAAFWALGGMLVAALWLAGRLVTNEYVFFMGYAVAQYILLATAWNLLGGYAGYINFGTAAFFALGAYVSVAINKLVELPLPVLILAGAVASGAVGLAMGYLTLKLRGVFFSIATLALAIVAQAAVTNWEFVGGASGAYLLRPSEGRGAAAMSSISSTSCWSWRSGRLRWRAASSVRRSGLACPPSATTNWWPKPMACRPCG